MVYVYPSLNPNSWTYSWKYRGPALNANGKAGCISAFHSFLTSDSISKEKLLQQQNFLAAAKFPSSRISCDTVVLNVRLL